jgi:hypothetical protein
MNITDKIFGTFTALIIAVAFVMLMLFASTVWADDPHHEYRDSSITHVTEVNNYTQVIDYDRIESLEKSLAAINALSSVPSLSCLKVSCTGIGVGFSGYNSGGTAIVLEHVEGNMSYRGGLGLSGDETVINFGLMGQFK